MPDDSCRRCGGTLTKYSLCAACKQVMQHICVECGSKSDGTHYDCHLNLDEYKARNFIAKNTYSISA